MLKQFVQNKIRITFTAGTSKVLPLRPSLQHALRLEAEKARR